MSKSILITDKKGIVVKKKSIAEAADYLNVSKQSLNNWLNGSNEPQGRLKGYDFKFIEEMESGDMRDYEGYDLDKRSGMPLPTTKNIKRWLVLNNNTFAYNELTDNLEVDNNPIDDFLVDRMCVRMEEEIGINNDKKLKQSITDLCIPNSYNPLKKKIESFEWDGEERAEMFFIKFLGALDTPLNRKYSKCWLKAAIKRLYEPGCMWDQMLILYDRTGGTGKTKIFERLSLDNYAMNIDVSSKDGISVMNTAWIINFDELARFDKKDMNTLKTFITTRVDVNRLAYARYAKEFKRHCVFCGTTNEQYFLRDYTSERERRFWIMNCNGVRRDDKWWKENLPDSYIHQVWAEVKHWYDEDPEIEGLTCREKDEEIMVQKGHKSFNRDAKTMQAVRSILESKYSVTALNNFKIFKKEVVSLDIQDNQIKDLEKVDLGWISAIINHPEDYISAIVLSIPGWLVRDGYAVKTGQVGLEF